MAGHAPHSLTPLRLEHVTTGRLPPTCMHAFDTLPHADVVLAQQVTTNMAGLASYAISELMLLDDTPPLAPPEVWPCTPGARRVPAASLP